MNRPEGRPLPTPTAEIIGSLLRDGMDVRVRLTGWSMKPLVPSGSMLRFSSEGELERGDVVLARLPNEGLLAHRVVALDSERVWTKGDACGVADGPFSRRDVLGRAVRLEGTISIPLSNAWMRAIGLAVNRVYPGIVRRVRRVFPRRAESAT
jgi:hypothetical protein